MVRTGSLKKPIIRLGVALAVGTTAAIMPSVASALPPGFLPTHFPGEARPEAGSVCNLTYGGGPLISQVQAVAVYWGSVSSTISSWAPAYIQTLVTSPAWDALSEYNAGSQKIVRGSFLKAYPITPKTQTGSSVDDSNGGIGQELEQQISAGALPQPTYDSGGNSNTIYVIFFAPGISISGGGGSSCVSGGFCGYHGSWTHSSHSVPYAVIPDMGPGSGCDKGCAPSGAPETDALGGTVSHELSEATTDEGVAENKVAWYDQNACQGEIGDLCAPGSGAGVGAGEGTLPGTNDTVQFEWSNKNKKCELTNPSIGPQGGCTSNSQCTAPTPVCNTTTQACVGCVKSSDCMGNKPVCDSTSHTCRACSSNSDCAAPTPVCAAGDAGASAGECVQCGTSSDCTSSAPVCAGGKCTGCTSNSDCTDPNAPECNPSTGGCGAAGSGSGSGGSGSGSGSGNGNSSGASGGSNSGSGGSGSGGQGGDGGLGNGDNNAFGGTTSSGCALSSGPVSDAMGFGGLAFGLAVLARARRSASRRRD